MWPAQKSLPCELSWFRDSKGEASLGAIFSETNFAIGWKRLVIIKCNLPFRVGVRLQVSRTSPARQAKQCNNIERSFPFNFLEVEYIKGISYFTPQWASEHWFFHSKPRWHALNLLFFPEPLFWVLELHSTMPSCYSNIWESARSLSHQFHLTMAMCPRHLVKTIKRIKIVK